MSTRLNIGLFGFGCVGQGLYHVLNNSTGFKADIVKVCVKNKEKSRTIDLSKITFDKTEILNNESINVVVELIDNASEAYSIVKTALSKGKHVVTANKKMLALHLTELYSLAQENKVSLLYEASACGSIPIIRALEEYFDNEDLEKVTGIFNGTTNYILTKTINDKLSYADALKQAQDNGFAESDPTNDVEGYDAKFKAVIIALHAFGIILKADEVLNIGITELGDSDISYAQEKKYKIKLTPVIKRLPNDTVTAFVLPQFIKSSNQLYYVDNEFNGVITEGRFSGEQFQQGRGAGSYPTGAAVLSDVSALSYGYKYEFKKHLQKHPSGFTNDVILNVYFRYSKPKDIELLSFIDVSETYKSNEYNYIIGKLTLSSLIQHKNYLKENKLFIALVNDEIQLA